MDVSRQMTFSAQRIPKRHGRRLGMETIQIQSINNRVGVYEWDLYRQANAVCCPLRARAGGMERNFTASF